MATGSKVPAEQGGGPVDFGMNLRLLPPHGYDLTMTTIQA